MRKPILIFTAIFVFILNAAAQNRTITGKVTDEKGTAVEGVSITSPDGKQGTQTDNEGNYSISIPAAVKSLNFTNVNFESISRPLGSQLTLNIVLKSKDTKLEEVVMVGYGTQQKKAFTGSASKVDPKEFAQLVTPSIDKQLQGRAAGVDVVNAGGSINTPAKIRIRGYNTISLGASPLILVDGNPITTGNLALTTNSNALGDINPADIENIDILKDGSALAIYGSRGANGVIQITTKKGAKNKTSIMYDATLGFTSPTKLFSVLDAQGFVTIGNEKFTNAGQAGPARMDALGTNTNWQDNVFVNNAFVQSHTLSLSGGTNKSTYYFSVNYSDQQGVVRTNHNRAFRVRANLDQEANKYIKFGNNITLSRQEDKDQQNGSNALSGSVVAALRALPNVAIYNSATPTGYNITGNSLGQGANLRTIDDNYVNIAFVLDKNKFYSDKYRIIDIAYLDIMPIKGLTIRSQLGIDYYTDNSFLGYDPRHGDGFSVNGRANNGQQNILATTVQEYFNYNKSFKKHSIYLTGGYELQQTTTRFYSATGTNISDLFFLKENVISTTPSTQAVAGNYIKSASESFFARLNYDYANRYFFQATIRRDGLSSLGTDNRYGNFPGFSVGWRPTQEKFWKFDFFNDIKLKASYAIVGNPIGGFRYLSTYGSAPYGNIGGIAVSNVGNPDLKWERSKKTDIGMELTFFRNRVHLTVDWFKNAIDQIILAVPTPQSAGIPGNSILKNIGTAENKGLEISLDLEVMKKGDFSWNLNFNYTNIKNKVTQLYPIGNTPATQITNPESSPYNIIRIGDPIFSLYGYRYAGVNAANGNPCYYKQNGSLVQRNVATGVYSTAASLNDPLAGTVSSLTAADKVVLGSVNPTYYGGFTNYFTYKDFGLEIMFRYSGGNKIMNVTRQEVLLNQKFANSGTEILNRWTTPGQVTETPKMYYANDAIINQNGEASTRFVEQGDFLRLQNIVLDYRFNKSTLAHFNDYIKSVRIFLQLQNTWVWTKYKGADPEGYSNLGIDATTSPAIRTISGGVSVGF
jgi:TonB-linked SusC/RagA family outer membrane protein